MNISAILLSLSLLVPAAGQAPGVHVLCYHAFLEKDNPFCFSIEELRDQIDYFREKGFTFVTLDDVINNRIIGSRNILVTVDDGNRTVYDAYFKVFKPRGIKPVLGIYPAVTGRMHYALTWDQLRELSNEGCVIAAHGYHHRKINTKLYHREKQAFYNEIYLSKSTLEKQLGKTITVFIYPYGVRSPVTRRYLKEAGYRYAFTIDSGGITMPVSGRNPLELPRYMLTRGNRKWVAAQIMKNTMHTGTVVASKERKIPEKTAVNTKPVKKVPDQRVAVREKGPETVKSTDKNRSPERKSPFIDISAFEEKGYLSLKPKTYRHYVERIGHVMKTVRRDVMSIEMMKARSEVPLAVDTAKSEAQEEGFFSYDFTETVEAKRKSADHEFSAATPELRGSLDNPGESLKEGTGKVKEAYRDMSESSYDAYARFYDLFKSKIDDMRNRLISLLRSRGAQG